MYEDLLLNHIIVLCKWVIKIIITSSYVTFYIIIKLYVYCLNLETWN